MDRLYTLTPNSLARVGLLLAALSPLAGCDEQSASSGTPPARYEAVTAKAAVSKKQLAGFCDVQNVQGFQLPVLDGAPVAAQRSTRWVNVWATWCKSCVEEMPMIEAWRKKWSADVLFVSADEEVESLREFAKGHPDLPASRHMKEPESLQDWMKSLNLGGGAGLPLHIFVDPQGQVLCARAGAVNESHAALVEFLLK